MHMRKTILFEIEFFRLQQPVLTILPTYFARNRVIVPQPSTLSRLKPSSSSVSLRAVQTKSVSVSSLNPPGKLTEEKKQNLLYDIICANLLGSHIPPTVKNVCPLTVGLKWEILLNVDLPGEDLTCRLKK